MRVRKPSLVNPELAHDTAFADQMGITTPRTIGQRTVELSADKAHSKKKPVLEGGWQEDTAGPNLAQLLDDAGVINNQTELGVPNQGTQIFAGTTVFENIEFTGNLQGPTASFDDLGINDDLLVEHITSETSFPPSGINTPVGTYPGAGTSPSAVTITGADLSGVVSFTTGTGAGAGQVFTIDFGTNKLDANYAAFLFPANSAARTAMANIRTGARNTGSVTFTADVALSSSTAYQWNYLII